MMSAVASASASASRPLGRARARPDSPFHPGLPGVGKGSPPRGRRPFEAREARLAVRGGPLSPASPDAAVRVSSRSPEPSPASPLKQNPSRSRRARVPEKGRKGLPSRLLWPSRTVTSTAWHPASLRRAARQVRALLSVPGGHPATSLPSTPHQESKEAARGKERTVLCVGLATTRPCHLRPKGRIIWGSISGLHRQKKPSPSHGGLTFPCQVP